MYLLVSLLQLNALVAGNGSYIPRPCGHDLHSPTPTTPDTNGLKAVAGHERCKGRVKVV